MRERHSIPLFQILHFRIWAVLILVGFHAVPLRAWAAPDFSPEIRALLEPCSALLLVNGIALDHLDESADSAEWVRAQLSSNEVMGRFRSQPRILVALQLTDATGAPLARPKNRVRGPLPETLDEAGFIPLIPAETEGLIEACQEEAERVTGFQLETLAFKKAEFLARSPEETSEFVLHLQGRVALAPLREMTSREKLALRYLTDKRLSAELVREAHAYGRSNKAEYLKTERLGFEKALADMAVLQRALELIPDRGSPSVTLRSARERIRQSGLHVTRIEKAGRLEIVVRGRKSTGAESAVWKDFYWRLWAIPRAEDFGRGKRAQIRGLIHVDSSARLEELLMALEWLKPWLNLG